MVLYQYLSGLFPAEVRVRNKLQNALLVRSVIRDLHLAVIINPQLADDDVVNGRRDLSVREVRVCLWEDDVREADRDDREVLSTEPGSHCEVLVHGPSTAFRVVSSSWRVMGDLKGLLSEGEMLGYCTCSVTLLHPKSSILSNSYVSPSSGLNGLLVRWQVVE